MKKLVEMSLLEVRALVSRNAYCKNGALDGIDAYSNARDPERVKQVAEACGACCVRPGCQRMLELQGKINTPNGEVYGGLIIGARDSLYAVTGKKVPNKEIFGRKTE